MRAVEILYFDKKFQLSECRYNLVVLELSPQGKAIFPLGNNNNSPQIFRNNHLLTQFNEFRYFSSLTYIWGSWDAGRNCGFYFCTNLEEIELPESIIELGEAVFYNCSKLKHLDFKNVQKIGRACFQNSSLEEAVFNEGFTDLSYSAGNYSAFQGVSTLRYVDFPSTTTQIGPNNFRFNSLVLVCRAVNPPTFGTLNTSPSVIYVPSASIEDYSAATNWSSQANKLRAIEGTWYETHRSLEPQD